MPIININENGDILTPETRIENVAFVPLFTTAPTEYIYRVYSDDGIDSEGEVVPITCTAVHFVDSTLADQWEFNLVTHEYNDEVFLAVKKLIANKITSGYETEPVDVTKYIKSADLDSSGNSVIITLSKPLSTTENASITVEYITQKATSDDAADTAVLPKLYSSYSDFEADYAGKVTYIGAEQDHSYEYIYGILKAGIHVLVKPIYATSITDEADAYSELLADSSTWGEFTDKSLYNIKFFTTGAHASYTSGDHDLYTTLVSLAYKSNIDFKKDFASSINGRGDAVALIDYEKYLTKDELCSLVYVADTAVIPGESPVAEGNYYISSTYASSTVPWVIYKEATTDTPEICLPGSFVYLEDLAGTSNDYANWYAVANIRRGLVNYKPCVDLGEKELHILQNEIPNNPTKICVNPIVKLPGNVYAIMGNRTLAANTTNEGPGPMGLIDYRMFLNVRVLCCDIKKRLFTASMQTMFEPNDDITWLNFKNLVNPLLDEMVANRGIRGYYWTRQKAETFATLKARLTIMPIEAVENFDLEVYLSAEGAFSAEEEV